MFSTSTSSFDTLGFSKLFTDFIRFEGLMPLRFPANAHLFSNATPLKNIAAANPHRAAIREAIESTMQALKLTPEQSQSLAHLAEPTTLTVITGQQVGFLGGALYTMLKACTAVQTARSLKAKHHDLTFVPIFWIEDNDHDLAESSQVGLINTNGEAYTLRASFAAMPEERTPIANIRHDEAILRNAEEAIQMLPSSEFAHETAEVLQRAYTPGTPLTEAFVHILQFALKDTGMLFVSAAELRRRGLFRAVVEKELENPGVVQDVVAKASSQLTEYGYHVQAQASLVNMFLHDTNDGKRHKINAEKISGTETQFIAGNATFSSPEIRRYAAEHPENFSPAVLLRPVVQDSIFPNAVYIAGPGEVSYLAQIKEIYPLFGVLPAATRARHSATFIDNRSAQFLEKQNLSPLFIMRNYDVVEKDLMKMTENRPLATAFEEIRLTLESSYRHLQSLVAAFDPTLDATADRTKNQSLQGLADLESKVRKAQKRMEETTFGKLRKIHALLFPMNSLQERALPYVFFTAKYGNAALTSAMMNLVQQEPNAHYFVQL